MFDDPYVTVRQHDRRRFELLVDLHYHGNRDTFVVPAGFVTDFASVPRPVIWLIPTYGVYTPAAILHDHLCVEARGDDPLLSRADADGLFRRSLRELGVSGPKRWTMWAGVRAGSWLSGASAGDVARFALVAVPAVTFLAVPLIVVTVWLVAARLIEAVWWLLIGRRHGTAPDRLRLRT